MSRREQVGEAFAVRLGAAYWLSAAGSPTPARTWRVLYTERYAAQCAAHGYGKLARLVRVRFYRRVR